MSHRALEVLAYRKEAAFLGFGRPSSGVMASDFGRTNALREQYAKNPPSPAPAYVPAAPQPIPPHVQAAKAKSLATSAQVRDLATAAQAHLRGLPRPPEPEVPAAQLEQRHTTMLDALKAVESSRARSLEQGKTRATTKSACISYPALDVLLSRAAA